MLVFNHDKRLITSDSKSIKYWTLTTEDQSPSLITSYSFHENEKLEFLYCNQFPVDNKDLFYFVIVKADTKGFIVCKNKIEEIWAVDGSESVNCLDFTANSKGFRAAGD